MNDTQNATLALTCLAAINGNEKRPEILERYIADAALRERILATEAALPLSELACQVVATVADTVVLVGRLRGRHEGDFLGVPATRAVLDIPVVMVLGVERARIARHWVWLDAIEAFAQMGAVTRTAAIGRPS